MFSRLFSSSKSEPAKESKRNDDSLNHGTGVRSASPTVTEPASIANSAPPGSPTRTGVARTPSPIPGGTANMDSASLRTLIKSCPAKTVYSYMLSQLDGASPAELSALSSFFQALTPPSHLHCVRCHKWFYEVDNDDRSCTMPHDDESAEVEHVGYGKSRGGAYETRWDCCGRSVEGSGDLGPPSGWCYEGKHTVDRKRARYRNDSTPNNDLLDSCEKKGCHRKREPKYAIPHSSPIADDARSMRSVRSARSIATTDAPKKRGRKRKSQTEVDDEEDKASVVTHTDIASVKGLEQLSPPKRKRRKTVSTKTA